MGGSHFVAVRVWSSSSSGEGDGREPLRGSSSLEFEFKWRGGWVKLKVEMGKVEMGDRRWEFALL